MIGKVSLSAALMAAVAQAMQASPRPSTEPAEWKITESFVAPVTTGVTWSVSGGQFGLVEISDNDEAVNAWKTKLAADSSYAWANPNVYAMVGRIDYVNQGAGQKFQGVGLQCASCYFGQMAYRTSAGAYKTIQFDEIFIYDNGEIEKPDFVTTQQFLTARGTWDGPSGVGEEWGQSFTKSDNGKTGTHWIWNYNDAEIETNWDQDTYIVAWLELQADGLWYGFTDKIDLLA